MKKPAGRTGGVVSCGTPVKAVAIGIVAAVVAVASGERATSAEIKAGELLKEMAERKERRNGANA